jgi:hypothetical protein
LVVDGRGRATVISYVGPHKRKILFPVPAPITFQERIKKNVIFISLNFMHLALELIVFQANQIHFVPYFN